MTKNHCHGFSLVEMLIVMAIVGILAALSTYAWQRYTLNTHLRTAARNVVGDFQRCKAKAVSESRTYQMKFTVGTDTYTISAPASPSGSRPALNQTRTLVADAGAVKITDMIPIGQTITFQTRGTATPGRVKLANNRNSEATITNNQTGKAYVIFNMQ
jgi:prepilin-type N-terminal cleavage/methylation domain-containing protein